MLRIIVLGGLWVESTEPGEPPAPKPRRLALLALVATAGQQGISRDRVIGVLWPDRDEARARHALSQTLYSLRQDLGVDAVIAEPTLLRLDPSRIRADLDDFRSAVGSGDSEAVGSLYRGPFLEGFALPDAPGFDQWADAERQRIRDEAVRALERAWTAARDPRQKADLAERLVRLDPWSGRAALRYMEALVLRGDRAAAIAHAKAHTDLVRQELETEPDSAVTAYAERLRAVGALAPPAQASASPTRSEPPSPARTWPWTKRGWVVTGAAAILIAAGAWLGSLAWQGRRGSDRPTIAIGEIRDLASPDSTPVSQILGDMLATSLGRLSSIEMVAMSRLLELLPSTGPPTPEARAAAARRAGATEILEGDVAPMGDGRLQLDIRRVDLETGRIRRGYRVSGPTRFDLIDSVTVAIANDMEAVAPIASVTDITTRSPIAYRFYEDGLRAYYQYDQYAAARLFRSALREDSTFALAAYYAWRSAAETGDAEASDLAARAIRLSSRASTRDRLIVRAHVAVAQDDPAGFAAAESLTVAFPNDPDALARAAEVFRQAGEPVDRVTGLLERAILLDSAASAEGDVCRACGHFSALAAARRDADRYPEAETTLRRWIRLRPSDPTPWRRLGELHEAAGRLAVADSSYLRARALGDPVSDSLPRAIRHAAMRGDLDAVATTCNGDPTESAVRIECLRGYRMLGRLREALILGRSQAAATALTDTLTTVMLDLEAGRPFLASASFRRLAQAGGAVADEGGVGGAIRYMTLAALAQWYADDTLQVRLVLSQIESLEGRALSGRRGQASRFVHGLLLLSAGQTDEGIAMLAAARAWPADDPRNDYELAQAALRAGEPSTAIDPLRAAYRAGSAPWGASVNRGTLHVLLGEAFAATGRTDSARVHFGWVARAWRGADPPLDRFQHRAESWLAGSDVSRSSVR